MRPQLMPQQVYQRILKLPCGDVREGVGLKDMLDAALKQLMAGICKPADGFDVKVGTDSDGHLQATITRGPHKMELQGRYGQNTIFKDGAKACFVSYTVHAESAFSTLPNPVRTMAGITSPLPRRVRISSNPSNRGITRSVMMASGDQESSF